MWRWDFFYLCGLMVHTTVVNIFNIFNTKLHYRNPKLRSCLYLTNEQHKYWIALCKKKVYIFIILFIWYFRYRRALRKRKQELAKEQDGAGDDNEEMAKKADLGKKYQNRIHKQQFFYSYCILRRPQNFAKSPPYFWLALHRTKVRWRFLKNLWPSQNI